MTQDSMTPGVSSALPFAALFEALSESSILLQNDAPRYTILAASPEYVAVIGMTKEYLVGKGMFEAFPSNPDDPSDTGFYDVRASLEMVRLQKKPHQLPVQRYDVAGEDGCLIERYWRAINKPVFTSDGEVGYIIHTAEDITDQIKAGAKEKEHQELLEAYRKIEESQTALHQSEGRYRNLFESMDQGYCTLETIFDGDKCINYRYLETNPAFERHLGLTGALGKTIRELAPDIEAKWFDFYGSVARTGIPIRIEEESTALNKWFEVYAIRVGEAGDNKVGVFFTDVTKRKKAEATSVHSVERQTFLLKLSDQLRPLTDPAKIQYEAACLLGEYLGANRVGYAEDGGDDDTIIVTRNYTNGVTGIEGRYRYDDYGPQLLKEFRAGRTVVRNNIADDSSLSKEEKQAHRDIQIGSSINVPLLKNGSLFGILFMHCKTVHTWSDREIELIKETSDRTWEAVERARTETALYASEEQFRFMVNTVPLSIWITDAEGKTEFLNKHWCNYAGESYTHTTAADIAIKHIHPDDAPLVMQVFDEAMQTGKPFEIEQRNRSGEGEYRWFLNRATPYKDPDTGKVLKWFGVGIDIHDRKLGEQALQRSEEELEKKVEERTTELAHANEELRRSNQNLEEFAYAASHDLKEPIRKIHFYSDRIKKRLGNKLEDEDRRYFERMELGTKRMATLIDDLLMYSHVSRGSNSEDMVDLNQTLSFVLDDLELQIEENGARIDIHHLPTIKGQARQFQQLFENLIGNALKYSKPDQVPEVKITTRIVNGAGTDLAFNVEKANRQYHLIQVQDNGIGFNPEDAERIFNVFTRLHGNAEYKGTGVGLSIARKVVENHGGYIRAESIPGKGATFQILLPAD